MSKLDCHVFGIPQGTDAHAHDYAHILLPLEDELIVRLDGEDHHVTCAHLAFIAPGRMHHCLCKAKIIMINIPPSMIKKEDLDSLSAEVCLPLIGSMVPLSELIKDEVEHNPSSDAVRYLYYYLYSKLVESSGFRSLRYMREHFAEELSVAHLARLENYNVSYFTDWFKKQTGASPTSYLRRLRIDKAKELLVSTSYHLIDVALQVGYGSNAAFSRAFRGCEGMSPVEYRRAMSEPEKA